MGERGTLTVGQDHSLAMTSAERGVHLGLGSPVRSFLDRFAAAYAGEIASFVDVVKGQRPPAATLADAVHAFRIAEACVVSRRERRPVDLAEIAGAGTRDVRP